MLLLGQSCTSPCSSDVPAPAGRGSSGVHDGAVACFCCCLVLCAAPTCSLDASRFTGGWELGPARLNRSLFPLPPCSSVASQSAGRELGQGGIGPYASPTVVPPFVRAQQQGRQGHPHRAQRGSSHHICIYIYMPALCLPKMPTKSPILCLRAEQNSVEFYFCLFLCFMCRESSIFRTFGSFET